MDLSEQVADAGQIGKIRSLMLKSKSEDKNDSKQAFFPTSTYVRYK